MNTTQPGTDGKRQISPLKAYLKVQNLEVQNLEVQNLEVQNLKVSENKRLHRSGAEAGVGHRQMIEQALCTRLEPLDAER